MESQETILDIENPFEEFEKLTVRFKLLEDRFIAIAMDYKYYMDSEITNNEIFQLRDSVLFRLHSARFHFQLLLEYHQRVEQSLSKLFMEIGPIKFMNQSIEVKRIQSQSVKEIYSIFDSMIYHLCSIYDYLFRLINFTTGTETLQRPNWNKYQNDKNKKYFHFCSKEMHEILKKMDREFVYPLYSHRSHLIHTENETGEFILEYFPNGESFSAKFLATDLFKENFSEISGNKKEITIKYSALWLIDKTLKTTTEILFELRDDIIRNKKQNHGFFVLIGDNGNVESLSKNYWGERAKC